MASRGILPALTSGSRLNTPARFLAVHWLDWADVERHAIRRMRQVSS
jgi:hypothetical protein